MADPWQFSDLYGANGLGFYVSDTAAGSAADRKRAVNDAYTELASIKGVWRKRTFDYTASSTPPLVDGTYQYSVPTTSGAVYDSPYRLYYRDTGVTIDVPIWNDGEWLERSTIATNDKGYPDGCRIVQTSATARQLELTPRISTQFLTQIGTVTLEYFIQIVQLSADADEPILPGNLRWWIVPVAAYRYAIIQGDTALAQAMRIEAEKAKLAVLKHDLTRTGRPRQLRPAASYDRPYGRTTRNYGD